jgi:hypothetical protein
MEGIKDNETTKTAVAAMVEGITARRTGVSACEQGAPASMG